MQGTWYKKKKNKFEVTSSENKEKGLKDYKELVREILVEMLKPRQNSTSIVASN